MDLLVMLFVIAIIGFGVYLITTYIPMDPFLYLIRALGVIIPNVVR